jgi:c(7)-type cytochrome triheme protein
LLLCAVLLAIAVHAQASPAGQDSTRNTPDVALKLPADIVYDRATGSDSAVVFSHQTHVAAAENRCTGCHPQPFRMLTRGPSPTHAGMNAGRSCGACHDGKRAFGVRDASGCRTCHSGIGGGTLAAGTPAGPATPPRRLPDPHRYPPSADSPGPVTFRHATHMKGATGCGACHPRPFAMKAQSPLPGGGMHEAAACGACHDGKKAFAAGDADACGRCHVGAGG